MRIRGAKVVLPEKRVPAVWRGKMELSDWILVTVLSGFVAFFSGAEVDTFLHTPDSEFYLSLGAFGDAVTDRAPDDSYFWTKLGLILPNLVLAHIFSVSVALQVYHFLLVLFLVGAGYTAARQVFPRLMAGVGALFLVLNTVVLGFLGDPYATGTAMTALALLYATTLVWVLSRSAGGWRLPLLMGGLCSWLIMVNPYAGLLGGMGAAGILLANLRALRMNPARGLLISFAAFVLAGALTTGAFVALGSIAFPGLNWLETLWEFTSGTDASIWAEKNWAWIKTETSLLVLAISAAVSVAALLMAPSSDVARTAAGLVWLPLVTAVAYKLATNSNALETSVYNALLWPSALLGVVLAVGSRTGDDPIGHVPSAVAIGILPPAFWIAAGHWDGEATPILLGLLCGAAGLVVALAMVSDAPPAELRFGRRVGRISAGSGIVVLTVLGVLFQFLQNGRPAYQASIHPRVEYEYAFRANLSSAIQVRNLEAQAWLISQSGSEDGILVWAEPPFITAAAMQLWGPNTVAADANGLTEAGVATIRQIGPAILATFTGTILMADVISRDLAAEFEVSDRKCRTFRDDSLEDLVICVNALA